MKLFLIAYSIIKYGKIKYNNAAICLVKTQFNLPRHLFLFTYWKSQTGNYCNIAYQKKLLTFSVMM